MRIRISFGFLVLLLTLASRVMIAQDSATNQPLTARCVIGLTDIKQNANGHLSIQDAELHFDTGKHHAAVPITSIENIFTGSEVTDAGGFVGEAARDAASAAPYDSGAALTLLLREKVDVLTVTYRDLNGGLHAAIFALPRNHAQQFSAELVKQGARSGARSKAATNATSPSQNSGNDSAIDPVSNLSANASKPAILVEPVVALDAKIPAEFRLAIYESLVDRIRLSGLYSQVYRSGDRSAANNPNVQTLLTEVEQFKTGSQTARELLVVVGETRVALYVKLIRPDGDPIVSQTVVGKVRFFGENLGVTRDAARRIVKILHKNLRTPPKSVS